MGYNEILVLKERNRSEKEAREQNGAGMLAGIGNYKERGKLIETITKEYINYIKEKIMQTDTTKSSISIVLKFQVATIVQT